jgi:hypothetical protein
MPPAPGTVTRLAPATVTRRYSGRRAHSARAARGQRRPGHQSPPRPTPPTLRSPQRDHRPAAPRNPMTAASRLDAFADAFADVDPAASGVQGPSNGGPRGLVAGSVRKQSSTSLSWASKFVAPSVRERNSASPMQCTRRSSKPTGMLPWTGASGSTRLPATSLQPGRAFTASVPQGLRGLRPARCRCTSAESGEGSAVTKPGSTTVATEREIGVRDGHMAWWCGSRWFRRLRIRRSVAR